MQEMINPMWHDKELLTFSILSTFQHYHAKYFSTFKRSIGQRTRVSSPKPYQAVSSPAKTASGPAISRHNQLILHPTRLGNGLPQSPTAPPPSREFLVLYLSSIARPQRQSGGCCCCGSSRTVSTASGSAASSHRRPISFMSGFESRATFYWRRPQPADTASRSCTRSAAAPGPPLQRPWRRRRRPPAAPPCSGRCR
jgi:hypothetical protein